MATFKEIREGHFTVVVQVGIWYIPSLRTPDVAKAITFVSEKTAASCFAMKEKCIGTDKPFCKLY
jgi:hypothetical protein